MIPNKNDKTDRLLIQCDCSSYEHLLEFKLEDNAIWINVIQDNVNLWQVLKWWWWQRKVWFGDILLSKGDVKHILKFLKKYDNK